MRGFLGRPCLAAFVVVFVMFPRPASDAWAAPAQQAATTVFGQLQDRDGDELPDAFDPDKDGDGNTDSEDPDPVDPVDPVVVAEPTPGTIDSGADSDNDELPNIQDPDDDNDGIVDEEDEVPFVPAPETPDVPAPTAEAVPTVGTTPNRAPVQASGDAPAPVVLALPSTGDGPAIEPEGESLTGAGMIVVTVVAGMGIARFAWQRR